MITVIIIQVVVLYCMFLLIDYLAPCGWWVRRRVRERGGKYIIQEKWALGLFWCDYGRGDIMGTDFTPYTFLTIKDARENMWMGVADGKG